MKLLYITNGINGVGGLERVLSLKASYFVDVLHFEVTIVGLNNGNENPFYSFSENINFESIFVKGNPIQYFIQYKKGIIAIINRIKPDIVLVCDDGLKGFSIPIIIGKKIPCIYERHVSKKIEWKEDFNIAQKITTKLKWELMDYLASKFDAFVVLTQGNTKEWKNLKNIHVIPNPLTFLPEQTSELKSKKVIAVGKQSYQKGFDLLLKAWQIVVSKYDDWELNIYGTKDASQGLETIATELQIETSVHFLNPVQNIQSKYLESSIFVLSSRYEGFGMVLIEAMACGVPCVSFDCPFGPSDIIHHEEDGVLVPNGNIALLANGIANLVKNNELRLQMGNLAKKNVEKYKIDVIGRLWQQLFNSF
ncbi:glycosyltransferase family 4 protein [Flavobacterium sp. J27]|uniref:glycosyltransferase family 4 protein n=1 Tax=Flavobacterium sp. J27 TaxID=2060419 RepID=UPI0010323E29|nr:glycosyltransferase family 4 protein [Flavobacterium sp. J27]